MKHVWRRSAATILALTALLLGTGTAPASAAELQGANRFENAPTIQTVGGIFRGDTFRATRQAGEPLHAGQDGGASVWFKWRAIGSGPVRFSTRGSDFDTVLAVYRGRTIDHLVPVKANDDVAGGTLWSRVQFQAVDGATYRIVIDGFNGNGAGVPPPVERGNYVLRVVNYVQGG